MFVVDLLATAPFYELYCIAVGGAMSRQVQLLSMLRLMRVSRLHRVITYMTASDEVKITLQVVKIFTYFFIIIHLYACMWFNVVNQD